MYRAPKGYDGVVGPRFDEVCERAFDHLFKTGVANLPAQASCLDLACGTGITTVSLAKHRSDLVVIGVDASKDMLTEARQRAEREGLAGRCPFKESDVHELTPETLAEVTADGRSKVEMITCALGYSVIPDWEAAFNQTLQLLHDDGVYVIFDQYLSDDTGLAHPGMGANQTRESWKLLERHFVHTDVKWFGNVFIAIGRKKKTDRLPPVQAP